MTTTTKMALFCACALIYFPSLSQEKSNVEITITSTNASVEELKEQIKQKEITLANSAASSRGVNAQLNSELNALYTDYCDALKSTIEIISDTVVLSELKRELELTEGKLLKDQSTK